VRVSILICTWNRASQLDAALERLAELTIPAGLDWEVVVVDNGSSDATPDVIASHAHRLPLVPAREPRLGLAHARNRAVELARGDLCLWIDDDVRVDRGWLEAYVAAERAWPDASFFGGPIEPVFTSAPPEWIRREQGLVAGPFAKLDLGAVDRRLAANEDVYGANMGFRTPALCAHPFDTSLGKVGDHCALGDETNVMMRLRDRGAWGVWVAGARVEHIISDERFRPAYISAYHRAVAELNVHEPRSALTIAGVPIRWPGQYVWARVTCLWRWPRKDARWAGALWRAAVTRGAIAGVRRRARAQNS